MTAEHFTGADGEIKIGSDVITVADFSLDITRSVIASGEIGKVSDKKYPGKLDISGSITQVLITPELLSYVLGDSSTLTTSTLETLMAAEDVSGNTRAEYDVSTNPTVATSVKCTLTVGDADSTSGSIVLQGTNGSDDWITEVIDFAAMTVGDASQVVYGSVQFTTTEYVDVSANLQMGSSTYNTLKIEGITGTKSMTPGDATVFNIIGKVEDADSNHATVTINNCFFTGGNFPVGDSDTLVRCDLPFVMKDADTDFTLAWTAT